MNRLEVIFLALLAIHYASSSALSTISRQNFTSDEELGTCPINSSISVKVYRNLQGEWMTTFAARSKLRNLTRSINVHLEKSVTQCGDYKYIALSGFLKDTDNSSGDAEYDYRNNSEGDASDTCKRRTETTAVDTTLINSTLQEVKKSSDRMKSLEDRQTILENTIAKIDGNMTLAKQSLTSLENILKTMNEKLKIVEEKQTSIENMLNVMNDTNNNLEVVGKIVKKLEAMENSMNNLVATPNNWVVRQFDATLKGKNIALSKDFKSATRFTGKDVPGTAGVISNSMLKEDEVFEIIIEEIVTGYTAGIAIGVINAKSDKINETQTIIARITGTWSIFSRNDSEKGKSIAFRDNNRIDEKYPLDTRNLKVGSVLGVSRRRNGDLHFYLDGVDCGPAFKDVPKDVYAFVDVLNYVTKIRIYS